ncbi:uncharacterized protein [Salminus brasiliensis]|uniref:uncharacterized protein isoform X2 n=1 Tax=Salminus brasiliensis TaxID=930266 RepID=UPI003B835B2A
MMMVQCLSSHLLQVLLLTLFTSEYTVEAQKPCEEQQTELIGAKGHNAFLHCLTTDQDISTVVSVTLHKQEGNGPNTLLYPPNNLTAEQQRLSLHTDSGKVMFVLRNVIPSDAGYYKCEVYKDQACLIAKTISLKIKECNILDSVKAVQNSAVTLTCPVSAPHPGNTQVVWEVVYGDRAARINHCPSSCTSAGNNRTAQLCERVRAVQDPATGTGSLTIRPVDFLDALWYRCIVQAAHGNYCSEMKVIVKAEPPVQPVTENCKVIGSFQAVLNSALMFTFPAPAPHPKAMQFFWGSIEGDKTVSVTRCPSPCYSSRTQRPLCERVQTAEDPVSGNASLIISSVESTDTQWFQLSVNASLCFTFKLNITDPTPKTKDIFASYTIKPINTMSQVTGGSHSTPSPSETSEGSTEKSTGVSYFTVMVALASTIFICIFVAMVALLVKMRLRFRKEKKKEMHKIELESQYAAYAEVMDNDNFLYSLVHHDPEGMCTFKDQREDL